MKAKGTYSPNGVLAQLWGGPTDANAFWFKSGNDDILNPRLPHEEGQEGSREVRSRVGLEERADDLRAVPRPDEQQHRRCGRRERQHRRRSGRHAEGEGARRPSRSRDRTRRSRASRTSSRAGRPTRSTSTCPTRRTLRSRQRSRCTRARSRRPTRRGRTAKEAADAYVDPGVLDHQGELHPALQGQVPEAERGLLRGVQAVLQVVG